MFCKDIFLSEAEKHEFCVWLNECCGMDIDQLQNNEIVLAYNNWQDECYRLSKDDYFEV